MPKIKSGPYRHFKGGSYWVYFTALHRDSGQRYVVYEKDDDSDQQPDIEVRTLEEFTERVERDGYSGPRFWSEVDDA